MASLFGFELKMWSITKRKRGTYIILFIDNLERFHTSEYCQHKKDKDKKKCHRKEFLQTAIEEKNRAKQMTSH